MKIRSKVIAAGAAILASVIAAKAVNIPLLTGPAFNEPSQIEATLNFVIQQINTLVTAQSVAAFNTPRNLLDNGEMLIQQRGTGTVNCGGTSGVTAATYSADRWACDVNVGSQAGQMAPVGITSLPQFLQALKLWRNSGALTQPVCAWQEIKKADLLAVQGKNIIASLYIEALAGLVADNGGTANLIVITGTGADEGLGSLRSAVGMTASPAITPAWTGLATLVNTPISGLVATAWTRPNTGPQFVATTVTEMAVGVCFTPTATGAGATDGIQFTGVQLEASDVQSLTPSSYEHRPTQLELASVQRFAYAWPEAASGVAQLGCALTAATTCEAALAFPVPMDVAPVLSQIGTAIAGGTTYKINSATAGLTNVSAMATKTANSVNAASFTMTTSGATTGQAGVIEGFAGGAIPLWSADF